MTLLHPRPSFDHQHDVLLKLPIGMSTPVENDDSEALFVTAALHSRTNVNGIHWALCIWGESFSISSGLYLKADMISMNCISNV